MDNSNNPHKNGHMCEHAIFYLLQDEYCTYNAGLYLLVVIAHYDPIVILLFLLHPKYNHASEPLKSKDGISINELLIAL